MVVNPHTTELNYPPELLLRKDHHSWPQMQFLVVAVPGSVLGHFHMQGMESIYPFLPYASP